VNRTAFTLLLTVCLVSPSGAEETSEVFVLLRPPLSARRTSMLERRQRLAAQRQRVLDAVRHPGVHLQDSLSLVSGFRARVTPAGADALRAHPEVLGVESMRYGSGGLDGSVPQIRADAVHRRDNLGQGVTVAVLDTGLQPTHPDIAGAVAGERCFCTGGCCPDGASQASGAGSAFTTHPHGMHVTGIIASQGRVAPRGVAPRVRLVAVKVLNDQNRGSLFDWIRGLEWVLEDRPDVKVVNASLVSDAVYSGYCDGTDVFTMAFAQAIDQLKARGTLTFVSSGNTADLEQMTAPACVRSAVSVGAVDRSDRIAGFTSRSTALDLLAPGTLILSDAPSGGSSRLSGTSMAAPHAAGAAALLLAWRPMLGPDAIEDVLKQRGKPIFDPLTSRTTPRLQALASFTAIQPASQPFLGGGSGRTDCLVEWHASPAAGIRVSPRLQIECRDGDPACDLDSESGRCTLSLTPCLNEPDIRLPRCASATQITAVQVLRPRPGAADPIDRGNANAILAALPDLPLSDADVCVGPLRLLVPVNAPKTVQLRVTAVDGRHDVDRLRLVCRP
jgi:hypothetical protein